MRSTLGSATGITHKGDCYMIEWSFTMALADRNHQMLGELCIIGGILDNRLNLGGLLDVA